jgi:DNA-binding beta-propeller fold protein YncE
LVSLLATLPLAVWVAGGSTIVAKVAVPGTPCGIAGSPGAVWVTEATNAKLVKIDPATNAVVKTVATDRTPCELKYASGSIWVVTQSGRVDRFDPATAKKLASIPVGRTTYDLVNALGAIWVTNRNGGTVQRISVRTNKVVRTVRFPPGVAPAGIGYAAGAI